MDIMDIFRKIESGSSDRLHGKISWVIAGLGNPGLEYEGTRHNTGFWAVDELAQQSGVQLMKMQFRASCGEVMLGENRCLLMKPTTYMNNSGEAVAKAVQFYKIPPEQVLVFYDDITLQPGKMRIRLKGSAGGHNGMKSIIAFLGTEDFPRVRLGVGQKPNSQYDLAEWVLSKFSLAEREAIQAILPNAAEAAKLIVQGNGSEAINRFN